MAASITDKFKKYSDGSDAPNVARVSSPRSTGGTTLTCDDLDAWATDTAVNFATYQLDTANEVVSTSITYWVGVVSGNTVTNMTRVKGAADGGNAINDVVVQIPDSDRFDDLVDGLLVSLDQDGTLKAGAVDNAAALANEVVTTAKLADASVTAAKRSGGFYIGTIAGATLGTTGNKAITGVGFTPKLVKFSIAVGSATTGTIIDGEGAMTTSDQWAKTFYSSGASLRKLSSTSACVAWTNATTSQLVASYVSMDADGFTINVTTASSGFDVIYEAYA